MWEDLLQHIEERGCLVSRYDAYCDLVTNGDAIRAAFRANLLATPEDFGHDQKCLHADLAGFALLPCTQRLRTVVKAVRCGILAVCVLCGWEVLRGRQQSKGADSCGRVWPSARHGT